MKISIFSSLFVSFLALSVEAKSNSKSSKNHHKSHNVAPELQGPTPYGASKSSQSKTSYSSTFPDGTGAKAVFLPRGYIVEFDNESDAKEASQNGKREVHDLFHDHMSKRSKSKYSKRYTYNTKLFTGLSLRLDSDEDLSSLYTAPGVKDVYPIRMYRPAAFEATPASDSYVKAATGKSGSSKSSKSKSNNNLGKDTFEPHIMTGVDKLHEQGHYGKGQTVGILDTGIDYTHPALNGGKKAGQRCFGKGCPISGGYDLVGDDYTGSNTPVPDNDPFADCEGSGHGTHVAGTVVANDTELGFTGVAPQSRIKFYRVFGCGEEATVSDDVIIAGLERAFFDGVDVISLSLGGPGGWWQAPSAAVASRISDLGTPVVMAAGNDGSEGMWYGSSPGVAKSGTGVGSVNNLKLTGYKVTVSPPASGKSEIVYLTGQPFTFNGSTTLEVYATSTNPEVTADACEPLPDDTPDLTGKVVVVARGTCTFVTKFANINAKGGKYVLVYNTPSPASITYVVASNKDQQVASLTREDGQALVKAFAAGTKTTLDFSDLEALTEDDVSSGGLMSSFSTYNPTYNLGFEPRVAAPGGNILSTWPLALGKYTIISGTSMATPFVSGSYALYRSIHGKKDDALKLRDIFTHTAKPVKESKEGSRLQTFAQAGPGLIDVYQAVISTTRVSPGALQLNDTEFADNIKKITVTNSGKVKQTYKLHHIIAGTAISKNTTASVLFTPYPVPLSDNNAHITYSQRTFTLSPGQSKKITVTFKPPTGLDPKSLPVYSGAIQIKSTSSPKHGTVSIPYMGLLGKMSEEQVLDSSEEIFGFQLPALSTPSLDSPIEDDSQTFSLDSDDQQPTLIYRLNFGTPLYEIDLVKADVNFKPTIPIKDSSTASKRSFIRRQRGHHESALKRFEQVEGRASSSDDDEECEDGDMFGDVEIVGMVYSERWLGRNSISGDPKTYGYLTQALQGTVTLPDGSTKKVEDGKYRLLIRAQRVFTDETEEASYDSYLSHAFTVKRGTN